MPNEIKQVQGDRYPVIQVTFKDRNGAGADVNDPDTWPALDISSGVTLVRVDYYQLSEQYRGITADATGDKFTVNDENGDPMEHTLTAGARVRFSSSNALPTGLAETILYYVVNPTSTTFQVSLTEGGAAVDITDVGTGQLSVIAQYDTTQATIVDAPNGVIAYTHPTLVWENPGDYDIEYVIVWTSPLGKETVYDRDLLTLRSR